MTATTSGSPNSAGPTLLPPAEDRPPVGFDLDQAWMLHPSVSVRPEPFGALLYHFGNRRLSFLKTRQLLDIVNGLAAAPDARSACLHAGAAEGDLPALTRALASLAAGDTIQRRITPDPISASNTVEETT